MSNPLAIRMARIDGFRLGHLRQQPEIEICELPDAIWVRVTSPDAKLESQLRAIPGQSFFVLPDGQLVARGRFVPLGHLPDGPWTRLSAWMTISLPPPSFAGHATDKLKLRLTRGGDPSLANLLLTDTTRWRAYAIRAPRVRLKRWAFAIDIEGRCVIRGFPLPPLTGERFVESSGIAVPAGWHWTPSVEPAVLRMVFDLESQDIAIVHPDRSWTHVRGDEFVRATRSAVRLSIGDAADA